MLPGFEAYCKKDCNYFGMFGFSFDNKCQNEMQNTKAE